jgi:hypothetical protein
MSRSCAPWRSLLFLMLFVPRLALGESTPSTAAYTGEPPSPDTAGRVAEMLALLNPSVVLAEIPVHLDTLVATDGLLTIGASSTGCTGGAVEPGAYREELMGLHDAVWEVEELAPVFDRVRGLQRCLSGPVDPGELARVSFIEGVMAFETGESDLAAISFAQVFAVEPEFPWDGQFGPGAEATFEKTRRQVSGGAKGRIRVAAAAGSSVWIDGRPVADPLAGAEAGPGEHLVQVGTLSGGIHVTVAADGDQLVVDGSALARDPAGDPGFADRLVRIAGPLFAALDGGPPAAPGYLVSVVDGGRAWRWDGAGGALVELNAPKAARAALLPPVEGGKKVPGPAMAVLLAVGGGLVAGGTALAAATSKDLTAFNADIESGELWPFPGADEAHPEEFPLYVQWQEKRRTLGVGYGLIAVGGAAMIASIPVGILTAKPAKQQLALGVTFAPRADGRPGPGGVAFTLSLRPVRGGGSR